MSEHDIEPTSEELPTTDRVYDFIDTLTSSQTRLQLLAALRDGPARKQELAERCGVSNSTVSRNCDDFQEKGLVSTDRREYQLTSFGERLTRELADFTTAIDHIEANQELFEHYRGRVEIPPQVLADLNPDTATSNNAQKALREYIEAVKSDQTNATTVRMLGGTTGPVIIDVIQELIEAAGHVDIIVSEGIADASPSGFAERAQQGELPDNFNLRLYPGDIRFGLLIIGDDRAMLGAYDEDGNVQAGAQGESETVINWANNVYETLQERARLVGCER